MGLSSTTDKQKEPAWRLEFEALGEQVVFENVKQGAIYNEAKRQAALRWLSERPPRNTDCSVGVVGVFYGHCSDAYQHHWILGGDLLSGPRRFPPPWSVEDIGAAFKVSDSDGQPLAYVYFEDEPGWRSAAKL